MMINEKPDFNRKEIGEIYNGLITLRDFLNKYLVESATKPEEEIILNRIDVINVALKKIWIEE